MIDDMAQVVQIIPIPAFKDNYIWLIHNNHYAMVVDPGDAVVVNNTLTKLNLTLQTILITHHHQDHIGGVDLLMETHPEAKVFAPKNESYAFAHQPVGEPDMIDLGNWMNTARVIDVPGHTLGHVAYYIKQNQQEWLFCGDTLFGAGCGRLFEGTPTQMMQSLEKLTALPENTLVFCTHEYTLHNINFALTLEPNNQALINRHQQTTDLINLGKPTLPSTIKLELATNPFLRSDSVEIQSSLQLNKPTQLETFSKTRLLRNSY